MTIASRTSPKPSPRASPKASPKPNHTPSPGPTPISHETATTVVSNNNTLTIPTVHTRSSTPTGVILPAPVPAVASVTGKLMGNLEEAGVNGGGILSTSPIALTTNVGATATTADSNRGDNGENA